MVMVNPQSNRSEMQLERKLVRLVNKVHQVVDMFAARLARPSFLKVKISRHGERI